MDTKQWTLASWVKASFWGWLLGVALILVLSSILGSFGIEDMQFYLGVGMGAGVGFAQWWVLQKTMPMSKNWIWFSALALGVPFVVLDQAIAGTFAHKVPASIACGALILGLFQFVLLKKHSTKAAWWIPGCAVAWLLAVVTVFSIDYTKYLALPNLWTALLNLLLILAGGIVLGLVSGIVLKKLLEHRS